MLILSKKKKKKSEEGDQGSKNIRYTFTLLFFTIDQGWLSNNLK
jgi:hypothetical protein